MAAPSVQTRSTPVGAKLKENFRSKFTFGRNKAFQIWEFEVTCGKIMGGAPIPLSTFFNTLFHTKVPQTLIEIGPFKVKGYIDPDLWKDTGYKTLINLNGECTMLWPDTGTLSFWGWCRDITFSTIQLGSTNAPSAEMDIEVSNLDTTFTERGPVWTDNYTGTADGT